MVPCFPLLGHTSEFKILCSTICAPSATRHNIHMYPYFLFAAIHHLKSTPTFSVRPCSSVGRVTVDLIRRSWVRFPPRPKDFFFASCGSLFPCTRANAQWVIHGFVALKFTLQSSFSVPLFVFPVLRGTTFIGNRMVYLATMLKHSYLIQ